jgi:hypothetical protein
MIPYLVLAVMFVLVVLFYCVYLLIDTRIEQRILKEELSVHFRLLHSIDRNVADLLTKTETEEDI